MNTSFTFNWTTTIASISPSVISFLSSRDNVQNELSPELRAAVLVALELGLSKAEVARTFQLDRVTVYRTLQRWEEHHTLVSQPRSSRPKVTTSSDDQYVKLSTRLNPRITLRDLVCYVNLGISTSTLKRRIYMINIRYTRAVKKIPLNKIDI